ncbi:MAG TPA: class I SAM-dependent methyltransferase [Nitrospirae bacterium]|nr:class I SAM-dependent methyltransferase [Nitrospirota bacterium]
MDNTSRIKETSYEYGEACQLRQADKYRSRENNHWKSRINLAHTLVDRYAISRLKGKATSDITVVDVGCSIGTFAIEFAKRGYRSYGVDFDPAALKIADQLSSEENVSPEFICGDIANWENKFPPIDIAVCFDIFEHLHDDELGSLLVSLKKQLSTDGSLVFHTAPTQYDYIFFRKWYRYLRYPLIPLSFISPTRFTRLVKAYASLVDLALLVVKGETYSESIRSSGHCNPTTLERLTWILKRTGYEIVFIETAQLYDFKKSIAKRFTGQPVTYRNLYGVAVPRN